MSILNETFNRHKQYALKKESVRQAKEYIKANRLSQEDFVKIKDIDPSPSNKYVGWMAKQWILQNVTSFDDLRNTIEEFHSFIERGKTKHKDLYQYKSFQDVKDEVDTLNKSGSGYSSKDMESDYETVVDDANLLVMVPHTHSASRKLGLSKFAYRDCEDGKDSAWCTTYKAPNHFNDYYYKNNVTFYYIKVKSDQLIDKLEANGYGPEFVVTAIAVLSDEHSAAASERGLENMEGYDGNDSQFKDEKLSKYLQIIGLK